MNALQARLLMETEFRFYQLQDDALFRAIMLKFGVKPEPRVDLLSDILLRKLNSALRQALRSPPSRIGERHEQ